VSQI
jgi:hypothetical protein